MENRLLGVSVIVAAAVLFMTSIEDAGLGRPTGMNGNLRTQPYLPGRGVRSNSEPEGREAPRSACGIYTLPQASVRC